MPPLPNFTFPVKVIGELRRVECFWAESPAVAEVHTLNAWSDPQKNVKARDAVEFARLATQKWSTTCELGTVARSVEEMAAAIRREPEIEVTAMLLASAKWFDDSLLGFCLFHRTWANNLFVDFLAAHPASTDPATPIKGIGAGLVHQVCTVAHALQTRVVWGETTTVSIGFYRTIFGAPGITDRLCAGRAAMERFRMGMLEKWATAP